MATKLTTSTMSLSNISLRTLIMTLSAAVSLTATFNVAALGLGALEVSSNLDQPLDGTIELRVAQGDDLSSVEAKIASREDFQNLGIDYPNYLSTISLSVEDMGSNTYVLRVVSGDVIIKEPFIHFLVRVDWSGGSFLREYTALIDPPIYAAETPQSVAQPRVVGQDESYRADSPTEIYTESLDNGDVVVRQRNLPNEAVTNDADQYSADTYSNSSFSAPTDAQYGPVASGESLSIIAQELQGQFPDLSIYQIMQVMFQENRGAFINDNINGLKKGVVLNIGDLNAIRQVDITQARQFFFEQLSDWDPSVLVADDFESDFDGLRVGQDEYSFDDSIAANEPVDYSSDTTVDPFQVGSSTETDALISGGDSQDRTAEVLALQQQISDLETSLASSDLENQELTERISLLEGQLADMNRLISLGVEDADMAAVEATLAAQNEAAPLSEQPPAEEAFGDTDGFVDPSELTADESGFIDPLATLEEAAGPAVDESVSATDSVSERSDSTPPEEVTTPPVQPSTTVQPATTASATESSFLSGLQSSVVDSGLWKLLAGGAALVFGGIALWFVRRRRADEEFEISMMSIESQSYSATQQRAATVSQDNEKTRVPDGDTSFLTVYSDSDAVVQADEVDPVAEADVYIAYGRDEQAEEVLLDGIASHPDRVDIKQKLLTLYHKNNNVQGFERIAEELYSQKNLVTKNVWQEISLMGKDLSPENPLFDVSSTDLLTGSDADDRMITSGGVRDSEMSIDADSIINLESSSPALNEEVDRGNESGSAEIEFAKEDPSIQLINFDEDQSQFSELDQVNMDELDVADTNDIETFPSANEAVIDLAEADLNEVEDSVFEIDLSDELDSDLADNVENSVTVELDTSESVVIEEASVDADSIQEIEADVSDLEIVDDYDEARTQYELAKVFVDLGDEDGARKILGDIVSNSDNDPEVLADATQLLASIDS